MWSALAVTDFTPCTTCGRDPQRMNNDRAECSHVECPNRRKQWSERPSPTFKGPWAAKRKNEDPTPLDKDNRVIGKKS